MRGWRGIRAATVTLGVGIAAVFCLAAFADITRAPGVWASEPPAASLVTSVLHDVRVHDGQSVRVVYRIDDEAAGSGAGSVLASLTVETLKGKVVRVLVRGRQAPLGVAQEWRGRLRLPAGTYLLVAHACDAAGQAEARAEPARLVVLRALPTLVPTARGIKRAFAWAAHRAGRSPWPWSTAAEVPTAFTPSRAFMSASVVKAMLLVAYLRGHPEPSAGMRDVLRRMIDDSDNAATDVVYGAWGRSGLVKLALGSPTCAAFVPSGGWITTRITAADMARFFRDMERSDP